jgi:hypothetical protein
MRKLIAETAAGRRRALERAQRAIQPLWRGAWTRMRLKRFAAVDDDDDDDMVFERVDVGAFDRMDEANQRDASRFATALRNTMGARDALFELPPAPTAAEAAGEGRPQSMPMPGGPTGRVSGGVISAGGFGAVPGGSLSGRRPAPSATLTPHSPDAGAPRRGGSAPVAQPEATVVDPEWGAGVAAAIKKRDAKQNRAKKDLERRNKLR